MRLVQLTDGICVNPDKVDFVIAGRGRGGIFGVSVISDHREVVSLGFDTPAEAEQKVAEWTAKINGEWPVAEEPMSVENKADEILNIVMNETRESSLEVNKALDGMSHTEYQLLLVRLHAEIAKYLGGQA